MLFRSLKGNGWATVTYDPLEPLAQAILQLDQQMTDYMRVKVESLPSAATETPQSTDGQPTTASRTTDDPSDALERAVIAALMKASPQSVQTVGRNGHAVLNLSFAALEDACGHRDAFPWKNVDLYRSLHN